MTYSQLVARLTKTLGVFGSTSDADFEASRAKTGAPSRSEAMRLNGSTLDDIGNHKVAVDGPLDEKDPMVHSWLADLDVYERWAGGVGGINWMYVGIGVAVAAVGAMFMFGGGKKRK